MQFIKSIAHWNLLFGGHVVSIWIDYIQHSQTKRLLNHHTKKIFKYFNAWLRLIHTYGKHNTKRFVCVCVCVMCVWTSATIRGRNHVWKYSFIFNCVLGLLLKEQISVIFLAHSLLHLFYIEILKAKHEICTHSNSDYTFKHPHVILFFFLLRHVRTHWNVENSELWIYRKLPNFEYVDWL